MQSHVLGIEKVLIFELLVLWWPLQTPGSVKLMPTAKIGIQSKGSKTMDELNSKGAENHPIHLKGSVIVSCLQNTPTWFIDF